MFNQLAELKNIGGVERLNFSIEFLAGNTARVVITSQVSKTATGEVAELLKRPIVASGTLSDLDMMLTNEIFNFSTEITHCSAQPAQPAQPEMVVEENVAFDELESL
ncbi:hypothetical protein [Shewanella aestuarii]|uniref:Uncharacterized protein n=1 Tax=Shewanella aestuarii TaxID=1028752 RepID=A0A6G9QRQ2_9GAMM|nr:hypothetical protein [Shewanella aestuarii]QIR16471.1 hypothetical protein HBH39_18540 [Shewanella aestuarii]